MPILTSFFLCLTVTVIGSLAQAEPVKQDPPNIHQKMIRNAGEVPAHNPNQPAESVSSVIPDFASTLNPNERIFAWVIQRLSNAQIKAAAYIMQRPTDKQMKDFASKFSDDHERLNAALMQLSQRASASKLEKHMVAGRNAEVNAAAEELEPSLNALNVALQRMEQALFASDSSPSMEKVLEYIADTHIAAAELTKKTGPDLRDPSLKEIATKLMPQIEKHTEDIRKLMRAN